jgi:hypothetical protein
VTPTHRLTEAYARGLSVGFDQLSEDEQAWFLIQDFILEREMGGLSGFFYNRLPEIDRIRATIKAMRSQDLTLLANLLTESLELFREYDNTGSALFWNEILTRYDPAKRLIALDAEINKLKNYGLENSKI